MCGHGGAAAGVLVASLGRQAVDGAAVGVAGEPLPWELGDEPEGPLMDPCPCRFEKSACDVYDFCSIYGWLAESAHRSVDTFRLENLQKSI